MLADSVPLLRSRNVLCSIFVVFRGQRLNPSLAAQWIEKATSQYSTFLALTQTKDCVKILHYREKKVKKNYSA